MSSQFFSNYKQLFYEDSNQPNQLISKLVDIKFSAPQLSYPEPIREASPNKLDYSRHKVHYYPSQEKKVKHLEPIKQENRNKYQEITPDIPIRYRPLLFDQDLKIDDLLNRNNKLQMKEIEEIPKPVNIQIQPVVLRDNNRYGENTKNNIFPQHDPNAQKKKQSPRTQRLQDAKERRSRHKQSLQTKQIALKKLLLSQGISLD